MNTSATIFLYLILFLIGVAIGGLIEYVLNKRSQPRQLMADFNEKLAEKGDFEVFEAWRTSKNIVWLKMDGKRMEKKEALLPEQRQRLLNLVLDLRPWLETVRTASPGPGAAPQLVWHATPEPDNPEQVVKTINNRVIAGEEANPTPVLESIIEQIDKVLQAKLATSEFKDRSIRLIEGPGGIVIIKDGVNKYEGVDTVPDPQVKTLIQQAVTDWEKGTK